MNGRLFLAALIAACAMSFGPAAGWAADWRDQGSRALIITYHVAPADRLAFRAAVRRSSLPRLEALASKGDLESYHVLVSRYVDTAAWDTMMILNFRNPDALTRWRATEARAPAGLSPKALRFVRDVETAPADPMRRGGVQRSAGDTPSVYLVTPYEVLIPTDDYLAYVDGYLLPQTDGWMSAGALRSYTLYLARYYPGRPWASLLVMEYRGDAGLARREAVVKSVRAALAASPEWKKIADNKAAVRIEKLAVVADDLAAGAPQHDRP